MRTSIFILIIGLIACREIEDPVDIGFDYFPLEIGNEWIYAIDSIEYRDFSESADTFKFFRKELIVSIADVAGPETRYNVDVSFKTDSTNWVYHSSMMTYKNDYRAVRSIQNKSVMHLLFPVKNRVFWDANQLNGDLEDRFRYIDTEKQRSMLQDSFPDNVFVHQAFDTTIIDEDIRWELYAEGVGLVERQYVSIEKQFGKRKGFDYRWKIISFRKN
ncbi:MAG: hypothetical protein ACI9JN_001559 [Bacteroidia bacterium]|jgi:hypothetical protein